MVGGRSQTLHRGDRAARTFGERVALLRAYLERYRRGTRISRERAAGERRRRERLALEHRLATLEARHRADAGRVADLERTVRSEKARLTAISDALAAEDAQLADAREIALDLRRLFRSDLVEAHRREVAAVDVVHEIRLGRRRLATVLYIVRGGTVWHPAWVHAAKRSAARHHADAVILVTQALPSEATRAADIGGITVVRPSLARVMAQATRRSVVAAARSLAEDRAQQERALRRAARARRIAALRASARRRVDLAVAVIARVARSVAHAGRTTPSRLAGSLRPRPRGGAFAAIAPATATLTPPEPARDAPVLVVEEAAPDVLPDEPVARALQLEARAQARILAADPGSTASVLAAAEALLGLGWRDAALDLLLERLSEGDRDRKAQFLLLGLAKAYGNDEVAAEKAHLLAVLLRMDGDTDAAARLEVAFAPTGPVPPPTAEVDPRLAALGG